MTEPTLAGEVEFADLGPATREAVRLGLTACSREIRLLEEKLTFPRVRGAERAAYERELAEYRDAMLKLLTQPYDTPTKPGQPQNESAGGEESPRR